MIFGIFRKIKRFILLIVIGSIILLGYILSSIFNGSIQFNTDFLTNSNNEDIIAVNDMIEDIKGNQSVEKVRILLQGLIKQAETFASTHTTLPTVYFDYSDVVNTNIEARYVFDYPDSLDEYIARLKEMVNALSSEGSYSIDYTYNDGGTLSDIFIRGQRK